MLERVLFASRRGFCGSVERAVAVVNAGGLTSGTSVPEYLVGRVCARFAARGAEIAQRPFVPEDVFLRLRAVIRGSG